MIFLFPRRCHLWELEERYFVLFCSNIWLAFGLTLALALPFPLHKRINGNFCRVTYLTLFLLFCSYRNKVYTWEFCLHENCSTPGSWARLGLPEQSFPDWVEITKVNLLLSVLCLARHRVGARNDSLPSCLTHNSFRKLKQRRRRRLQKRHLKSEFTLPQTFSRLFNISRLISEMLANFCVVEF